MIEMLGVLAIIGVLSVGGIAGYSKAMHRYRVNKTIEQISMLASNIRTFFAPQRNYLGLDSWTADGKKLIQKAKLAPDDMIELKADGTIAKFSTPIANDVSFWVKTEGNEINTFIIYLRDFLSEEACIDLMSQDWSNLTSGLVGIEMGGTGMDYDNGCDTYISETDIVWCLEDSFPIPMENVLKGCSLSGTGFDFDGIEFKIK